MTLKGQATELGPQYDVLAIQRCSINSERIRGQQFTLVGPDKTVLDSWNVPDDADQDEFNAVMLSITQLVYQFLQRDD